MFDILSSFLNGLVSATMYKHDKRSKTSSKFGYFNELL